MSELQTEYKWMRFERRGDTRFLGFKKRARNYSAEIELTDGEWMLAHVTPLTAEHLRAILLFMESLNTKENG